jgi:phosphate transport system permease protein
MIMKEPGSVSSAFTRESLKKKFRFSEFISEKIISGVAFLTIAIILLIFVFVFKEALPIFHQKKAVIPTELGPDKPLQYGETDQSGSKQEVYGMEPDTANVATGAAAFDSSMQARYGEASEPEVVGIGNLLGTEWQPVSEHPRYGLIPLLVGTLKITLIAILFAAPIAILAALFSAAFAPHWLRELIKPAVEILAGFPSVVIGFFALMVMATFFQDLFGYGARLNAFVGGVAMAIAAIPIIFTVTEDVMTAVPGTYKEASLALGASSWQTAFYVTLPASAPGIFAAVLLGIGRIFGETMIVLMATGNAVLISANPFESVRTFAATIGAEMAEVVFGDTHYSVLFLIGALLFIFTFSLNAVAEFYVKSRLLKRFQGKTT